MKPPFVTLGDLVNKAKLYDEMMNQLRSLKPGEQQLILEGESKKSFVISLARETDYDSPHRGRIIID